MCADTLPYVGYHKRSVPEPDRELTSVGPDTPCGEWMRRAWQPIAMSQELGDLPLALRILGEDLVLFRDKSGRLGLLHKHCSHRGASLEYGVIMECGISCCYHGWHFDVDGRILDTPAEPPESQIKHRLRHGAYPVREFDGLIFAWMGPTEAMTDLPIYDVSKIEGTTAVPFSIEMPCNWLQVYENTQDPVHVVYLHTRMSGAQFGDASGAEQVIDYRETPLGMANVQTRRWGDHLWTRMVETILPNANQTGAIWEAADHAKLFQRSSLLRWMVPVDDTRTVILGWRFFRAELDPSGQGDPSKVGKQSIDFIGQVEDRPYEQRQRQPGDYEVQVSQRPIAVHALENLASSDRGVATLRRLIRRSIRKSAANQEAPLRTTPPPVNGAIGTFCQDTVWPISAVPTGIDLMTFGTAVADNIISTVENTPEQRMSELRRMLTELKLSDSRLAVC